MSLKSYGLYGSHSSLTLCNLMYFTFPPKCDQIFFSWDDDKFYLNDSILIFTMLNLLFLLYFVTGNYNESKAVQVRPSSHTFPKRFMGWLRFERIIKNRDLWKYSLSEWKRTMWHLSFWIQAIGGLGLHW